MIIALKDLPKGAFSQPLHNFEPVADMVVNIANVFVLVIVKTVIIYSIRGY